MSCVLLISTNTAREPYPVYPLGMATVAAALREAGHTVHQFDWLAAAEADDSLRETLRRCAPDLVGVSLRNIDNVDSLSGDEAWYLGQARTVVQVVRSVSTAPVVLGGPAFSLLPEEILEYTGADHGVVGEGEQRVCDLLRDLQAGRTPPPILRPSGPALAGARQAAPAWDPELVSYYAECSGMLNLQTKRGCPYRCAYCTYPTLEGKTFRRREPGAVVDDMERGVRDFGARRFFFTDSVFNDPGGHHLAVVEELLRRRLELAWYAFFRPQGLGREQLRLMKRSGLAAVELGTDASTDTTLAALDKDLTFADVLASNRACVAEGVPCAHFVMFGVPGETRATVEEGLGNMDRLEHCVVFAFSGVRILPGTGVQRRAVAEGVIGSGDSLLRPLYYHSPRTPPEFLNARLVQGFAGRRDRIFPPAAGQERLAVMRRFGYQGPLWDQLVRLPKAADAGAAAG